MNRTEIAALIPHSGAMCLLARVDEWDARQLICSATNHRDADHPLRTRSGLLAGATIEYAAQAMALHGALTGRAAATRDSDRDSGANVPHGYLASARGVQLHVLRLDDLAVVAGADELRIRVELRAGDAQQILYTFDVSHAGCCVAEGRAAVVLSTALRRL